MPTSVVKPGYGPTLPQLVGTLPRWLQWIARAVGIALLLVVLWWIVFGRGSDLTRVIEPDPVAFNVGYKAPFEKVTPAAGERLRFEGGGQEFVVKPLHLPAYEGVFSGFLPTYTSVLGKKMERERPGLLVRSAGNANINKVQGYQILYQAPGDNGQRRYGRRIFLLPDDTARDGLELVLEADATAAVVNPTSVGRYGPLKPALRSFRFGTDAP